MPRTLTVNGQTAHLTSVVMHPDDELRTAGEQLVSYCGRLIADGLAVGAAGNMSVRVGDLIAITPSGVRYGDQPIPRSFRRCFDGGMVHGQWNGRAHYL